MIIYTQYLEITGIQRNSCGFIYSFKAGFDGFMQRALERQARTAIEQKYMSNKSSQNEHVHLYFSMHSI